MPFKSNRRFYLPKRRLSKLKHMQNMKSTLPRKYKDLETDLTKVFPPLPPDEGEKEKESESTLLSFFCNLFVFQNKT
jgi:hypothetical protein